MMEIVHDMAPGAHLLFATAFNGVASFANNIVALQAAGAKVIVDDVTYFNEGAFQDGPIARAVNQVTANGAIYFSSAANSGSLTLGTSGTWEGDFLPDGSAGDPIGPDAGTLHNFGTAESPQDFDALSAISSLLIIVNNTGAADVGVGDPFHLIVEGFVDGQFTEPEHPDADGRLRRHHRPCSPVESARSESEAKTVGEVLMNKVGDAQGFLLSESGKDQGS